METDCRHPRAETRKYVGSEKTYKFCPGCWETFGGEETPAKKALVAAAARYDESRTGFPNPDF